MRSFQVRLVVLLGALSIIGIIVIQGYFLVRAWSIREKQVNQTIFIALKKVAAEIGRLNNATIPYDNPVKQIAPNYFVVEVNTVIDANVLEFYLKKEFSQVNLHTDYEYAIYDCHSGQMVYGNYITDDGAGRDDILTDNLPKYDRFIYYFGIRFPAINSTIASDMTTWFFFSTILLLCVVFFAYAIFVILQQKRGAEMQRDFINNMTHEFKTPMSSIRIAAEVLSKPGAAGDGERIGKYASIILRENNRLILLVEKILQIAQVEKKGIRLKKEPVHLQVVIDTVATSFSNGPGAGCTMNTRLDPDIGPVEADLLHITNILFNLLDNAVKYAGINSTISIDLEQDMKAIWLSVSDNGAGISPEFHEKVFRKFFRIPSGNLHDVKGFGLGLFYVKMVCRSHGWNIGLTSKPGKGSVFLIRIPKKRQ